MKQHLLYVFVLIALSSCPREGEMFSTSTSDSTLSRKMFYQNEVRFRASGTSTTVDCLIVPRVCTYRPKVCFCTKFYHHFC